MKILDVIILSKTKDTVMKSTNPRLNAIEQVLKAKLLNVLLDHKLNLEIHVDFVLILYNKRVYLMKLLRDQGLSHRNLDIIFRR